MKLSYDEKKEKEPILREMWRSIFGDPKRYEDFYYQSMYPQNQVLTEEWDEEVVGMIHLNPYVVQVGEASYPLHYIVGVATLEKCRRQGVMRNMLVRCMKDMAERGEIFTYLMPADRAYYEPFDFAFIQRFAVETMTGESGKEGLVPLTKEEFAEASVFLEGFLKEHFGVYTKLGKAYLLQLREECESEDGELLILKDAGKIVGFCCYGQEETVYVRQIFCQDPDQMKAAIAGYFPGKQIEMTVDGGENGKGASIMARILRLDLLVPLLKGKKECEFLIGIQDNYLEQQNGNFCFRIGKESCGIEKTSQIPEKSIGIQDLTKILFGFEHLELLSRYPDFEAIEPLGPVMIGEII